MSQIGTMLWQDLTVKKADEEEFYADVTHPRQVENALPPVDSCEP
jgi:hypothetical protein